MVYTRFLKRFHAHAEVDWYLEIGCRTGATFAPARARTIAVDPYFRVDSNVIGAKRALHLFQTTSDDFFASGFLEANRIEVSFAFIDGMHLVEYALRDFINLERHMTPRSAIAIHDVCPWTEAMTTRDLERVPRGAWTGDVWKLIPILQRHRPDLRLTVLDCAPTGLLVVTGLDPANRSLADAYDGIVAEHAGQDIAAHGMERFYGSFDFTAAAPVARGGFALLGQVPRAADPAVRPVRITP
jgi:hypothetical protein